MIQNTLKRPEKLCRLFTQNNVETFLLLKSVKSIKSTISNMIQNPLERPEKLRRSFAITYFEIICFWKVKWFKTLTRPKTAVKSDNFRDLAL